MRFKDQGKGSVKNAQAAVLVISLCRRALSIRRVVSAKVLFPEGRKMAGLIGKGIE